MEFQTIEEMADVCALEIAAPAAEDIQEVGAETEPEKVQFTQKSVSNSWDEAYQPRITIEELLTINSRDSIPTQAAKHCINEILSRRSCSRPVVALYRNSGGQTAHDCAPTNVDFTADFCLAAKHVLPLALYQVLCVMLEEFCERWDRVPASVQKFILERTGAELIRRKIWSPKRGTKLYWRNDLRQNGRPSAPASFRLT